MNGRVHRRIGGCGTQIDLTASSDEVTVGVIELNAIDGHTVVGKHRLRRLDITSEYGRQIRGIRRTSAGVPLVGRIVITRKISIPFEYRRSLNTGGIEVYGCLSLGQRIIVNRYFV